MKSGKQKRRLRTQLALIYTLMVLSVVSIVAILVLVVQGYRFNWYDGKVAQGGLIQFDSRPTGATVTLDQAQLANRTTSKITATAGEHTVTMSRDGYHDWQKTVTVKPGSVLWLDYVRLLPKSPKVTTSVSLPGLASHLVGPEKRTIAVVQVATDMTIGFVDIAGDNVQTEMMTVNGELVTSASDAATQSLHLIAWDRDGRQLILRHDYDGKSEYLVVDAAPKSVIRNLTTQLGVDIKQVKFLPTDNAHFVILTANNELRRADMNAATLSGPMAGNISEFNFTSQSTVLYTTLPDANAVQSVGYISNGSTKPKLLASYDHIDGLVHADTAGYYGRQYTVISKGTQADVYVGVLPSSENATDPELTKLTTLDLGEQIHYVGFSPDLNRNIYVQGETKVLTYDLELAKRATIELAQARRVDWLDGFHISSSNAGVKYMDYDGTNSLLVAEGALDIAPVLSRNEKFIYHFAGREGAVDLVRTQLID